MNWNLEGLRVSARYMGEYPITGKVRLSRVKYGGTVSHHIDLDSAITLFGVIRTAVIVEHFDITKVFSN